MEMYIDQNEKLLIRNPFSKILEDFEKVAINGFNNSKEKEKADKRFEIRSILANHKKNAFTVAWADGTYTVIHLQEGDVWDDEKALAMCFVKKLMGNKGSFNNIFTEELPKKMKTIPDEKVEPLSDKTIKQTIKNVDTLLKTDNPIRAERIEKRVETEPSFDLKDEKSRLEKKLNKNLVDCLSKTTTAQDRAKLYALYHGDELFATKMTKKEINDMMHNYVRNNHPGLAYTPWRLWSTGGNMYVDYGRSTYFRIPNAIASEWINQ